ncbi:MAG TPA: hypothetical protein VHO69_01330, partial [Phototrophicaceae bacterium]|nr:hypothetical protein [Phototrophicaceae bacterium]
MVTTRWFGLALILPGLLLLAGVLPFLTIPALAYGTGLALLTWLDRRTAGNVSQFRVGRQHDSKLSLGVPNPVTLTIESRAARPLEMTIRDEPPIGFVITDSATQQLLVTP